MDRRFTVLGMVVTILAAIGLTVKYVVGLHGIPFLLPISLLVIGFVLFGYGLNSRSLILDIGAALVVVSIIMVARASFLWLILALGLGIVAYARSKTTTDGL